MQRIGPTFLRRVRRFAADEEGSSEVETILILALVVLPLTAVIPVLLVKSFVDFWGRIGWWINLPFP